MIHDKAELEIETALEQHKLNDVAKTTISNEQTHVSPPESKNNSLKTPKIELGSSYTELNNLLENNFVGTNSGSIASHINRTKNGMVESANFELYDTSSLPLENIIVQCQFDDQHGIAYAQSTSHCEILKPLSQMINKIKNESKRNYLQDSLANLYAAAYDALSEEKQELPLECQNEHCSSMFQSMQAKASYTNISIDNALIATNSLQQNSTNLTIEPCACAENNSSEQNKDSLHNCYQGSTTSTCSCCQNTIDTSSTKIDQTSSSTVNQAEAKAIAKTSDTNIALTRLGQASTKLTQSLVQSLNSEVVNEVKNKIIQGLNSEVAQEVRNKVNDTLQSDVALGVKSKVVNTLNSETANDIKQKLSSSVDLVINKVRQAIPASQKKTFVESSEMKLDLTTSTKNCFSSEIASAIDVDYHLTQTHSAQSKAHKTPKANSLLEHDDTVATINMSTLGQRKHIRDKEAEQKAKEQGKYDVFAKLLESSLQKVPISSIASQAIQNDIKQHISQNTQATKQPQASTQAKSEYKQTTPAPITTQNITTTSNVIGALPKISADTLKAISLQANHFARNIADAKDGIDPLQIIANLDQSLHLLISMLGCGVALIAYGFDQEKGYRRKVVWANQAFYNLTGHTKEEYTDLYRRNKIDHIIHPDDIHEVFQRFNQQLNDRKPLHILYRALRAKSKEYVWCDSKSAYVGHYEDLELFINIINDVTKEKRLHDEMKIYFTKTQLLSDATEEIVIDYDISTDTMEQMGNYREFLPNLDSVMPNFFANHYLDGIIHEEDLPKIYEVLQAVSKADSTSHHMIKARCKKANSNIYQWHEIVVIGYIEESTGHPKIIGKVRNIDRFEAQIESLKHASRRDPMTNLLNKVAMESESTESLLNHGDMPQAMMMVDIDNFKQVNDTHGHAFGDEVIKLVANCLNYSFRKTDFVARMGGDEFLVLLRDVSIKKAISLAHHYHRVLKEMCKTLSIPYTVSSSVGLAFAEEYHNDYDSLYHAADEALYLIKREGKGRVGVSSISSAAYCATQDPEPIPLARLLKAKRLILEQQEQALLNAKQEQAQKQNKPK